LIIDAKRALRFTVAMFEIVELGIGVPKIADWLERQNLCSVEYYAVLPLKHVSIFWLDTLHSVDSRSERERCTIWCRRHRALNI